MNVENFKLFCINAIYLIGIFGRLLSDMALNGVYNTLKLDIYMENIGTGLMLMLVGMCTVFVILLIIIWLSTLLIKAVNKFAPPEEEVKSKPAVATVSLEEDSVKAINIAVEKLTGGKGKVMKIEKL